jgi:hypothetical protein
MEKESLIGLCEDIAIRIELTDLAGIKILNQLPRSDRTTIATNSRTKRLPYTSHMLRTRVLPYFAYQA